jgi:hypothetical protein
MVVETMVVEMVVVKMVKEREMLKEGRTVKEMVGERVVVS